VHAELYISRNTRAVYNLRKKVSDFRILIYSVFTSSNKKVHVVWNTCVNHIIDYWYTWYKNAVAEKQCMEQLKAYAHKTKTNTIHNH